MPRYYFPLIIVIILVELVVLIFALLDILPVHPFHINPTTGYLDHVGNIDLSHISLIVTRWFFFLLTAGVLLPMVLIISLEVTRRFINSRKKPVAGEPIPSDQEAIRNGSGKVSPRIQGDYILRFDVQQRIQHLVLVFSFIVLAITGIIRGFPEWPTMQWWMSVLGGPELLRLVHDIAAYVMCADGIYHLLYLGYGIVVKKQRRFAMVPNFKDLKDTIHTFLWIFGKREHEPLYDRFTYGQKIDYWAILWGLPVMVITGAIMMFPGFFSTFLSPQVFAACNAAHRDEAILAIGFIIIVHVYYGHFQTSVFPMNKVFLTGKMRKATYKEWFGREYVEIMEGTGEDK